MMNIRCISKLFFLVAVSACIQQSSYTMLVVKKFNDVLHEVNKEQFGKNDCDYAQTELVRRMLKENGVENPNEVPIKKLNEKWNDRFSGYTLLTGLWFANGCDVITTAHEVKHYLEKDPLKQTVIIPMSGCLSVVGAIIFYKRYIKYSTFFDRFIPLFVGASVATIMFSVLERFQEKRACNFSINWACDNGYEEDVQRRINLKKALYESYPEKRKQFNSICSSAFENYTHEVNAYAKWKEEHSDDT